MRAGRTLRRTRMTRARMISSPILSETCAASPAMRATKMGRFVTLSHKMEVKNKF